ncbi:porin, partial [Salmonella enterica]|uniref:porin n=1 Tax=Salmonella enterica TaxID=28901 RepID=UPI0032981BFD
RFGVTAAYSNSKRTKDQQDRDGNGDRAESWAVGAKYDANNVYLAALYADARNMCIVVNRVTDTGEMGNKTQNLEVVAQ